MEFVHFKDYTKAYNFALQKHCELTGEKFIKTPTIKKFVERVTGKEIKGTKKDVRSYCWKFLKDWLKDYIPTPKYIKVQIPITDISPTSIPIPSAEDVKKTFYQSHAWRTIRVDIIEEQEGKCQMCGRSFKEHGIAITVDHIIPLSIDWSRRLDKTNLQLLCEDCNKGKGNRYSTTWKKAS